MTHDLWLLRGGPSQLLFLVSVTLLGLDPPIQVDSLSGRGSCAHLAAGHLTSLPGGSTLSPSSPSLSPGGTRTIWITCSPAPSLCPCSSGVHTCLCTLGHPDWAVRGLKGLWWAGGTAFPKFKCPFGPSYLLGMESGSQGVGGCIPGLSRILRWGGELPEGVYQLGLRAIHDCPDAVPVPGVRASCRCAFIQGGPGRRGCRGPATARLSWQVLSSVASPFCFSNACGHLEGGEQGHRWVGPGNCFLGLYTSVVTCFLSSGQRAAAFPI